VAREWCPSLFPVGGLPDNAEPASAVADKLAADRLHKKPPTRVRLKEERAPLHVAKAIAYVAAEQLALNQRLSESSVWSSHFTKNAKLLYESKRPF
jgi:hypothetical protein